MGEAAKAFWIDAWIEEELHLHPEPQQDHEDIALLSTGIPDELWLFGSD